MMVALPLGDAPDKYDDDDYDIDFLKLINYQLVWYQVWLFLEYL